MQGGASMQGGAFLQRDGPAPDGVSSVFRDEDEASFSPFQQTSGNQTFQQFYLHNPDAQ